MSKNKLPPNFHSKTLFFIVKVAVGEIFGNLASTIFIIPCFDEVEKEEEYYNCQICFKLFARAVHFKNHANIHN